MQYIDHFHLWCMASSSNKYDYRNILYCSCLAVYSPYRIKASPTVPGLNKVKEGFWTCMVFHHMVRSNLCLEFVLTPWGTQHIVQITSLFDYTILVLLCLLSSMPCSLKVWLLHLLISHSDVSNIDIVRVKFFKSFRLSAATGMVEQVQQTQRIA